MALLSTLAVAAPAQAAGTAAFYGLRVSAAADDTPFPVGRVYCTRNYHKPGCLLPLSGRVSYLGCGEAGGDVDIVVSNPNRRSAPRDISVFVWRDGAFYQTFGDRDWAQPGVSVVSYRGFPNNIYRITLGWDDQRLAFFGRAFMVICEGGQEPPPPPV